MTAELSIVVLSWNTCDLLRECLRSVCGRDHGLELEVIVVDNASEDDSADMVAAEFPAVRLLRNDRNEGYARGNNIGVKVATADLVLLLNSDTEIRGDALRQLVEFLRTHPEHGAVAPRLVSLDGTVQRSCMRFPGLKVAFLYDSLLDRMLGKTRTIRRYFMEDFDHLGSRDVDQPPGAAFLVRREVIDRVGLLDEDLFLFFNDVDYCRRIQRAGYRIHYLAEAEILHHIGRSTSKFKDFVSEWQVNRVRYYRKHHGFVGVLVVKLALLLRGGEELAKIYCGKLPGADKKVAMGDIRRVMNRALRA